MGERLQSVKGMNDILPEQAGAWQEVERLLSDVARAYDYHEIRTPILESANLFVQAIGEQTDIVEKEMYAFTDTGGEQVCMRPECTAAVVRAGVQHGLFYHSQARLWYLGPMFRRERPQKGRYRQFHQFGMEAIGWSGPDIDAELLLVGARLWKALGVEDVTLHLNTLGSEACRASYRDALVAYFSAHKDHLDEDSQRRLARSPLRILDSKHPDTQRIAADAPRINDYLDDESRAHFEQLQRMLDEAGVPYLIDQTLVRGLDYYTSTVFEWKTDALGAQGTICAGGRYDRLVESRGGQAAPACGFAMGIERLIELRRQQGVQMPRIEPDIYFVNVGDAAQLKAIQLAEQIRDSGLTVSLNCGGGKFKAQLKRADKSGAKWAFILGDDEIEASQLQVKPLRAGSGADGSAQQAVGFGDLAAFLATLQAG